MQKFTQLNKPTSRTLCAELSKAGLKIYSNENGTFDIYSLDNNNGEQLTIKHNLNAKEVIQLCKELSRQG